MFGSIEDMKREEEALFLHLPSTQLIGRSATGMINDAEQPAVSCSSAAQGSHCWVPHSSYELGC